MGVCADRTEGLSACVVSSSGDPENPPCARLTLVGKFTVVAKGTEEYAFAKNALFERHPSMADWPSDHAWVVAKIDVQSAWTIDFYGGATILTPEQYYGNELGHYWPVRSEQESES